jgi:transposase InsO family protein
LAGRREPKEPVLPRSIERGQYTSAEFAGLWSAHGVRQSMGKTGICWDNAAESFFATLKRELVFRHPVADTRAG